MPNHTARTERSEAGTRSIACAVERSLATVTPAKTPARTAVAIDEPENRDERSAVAAPKTLPGKRGDEPRGSHVSVLRRCR